ncbi:hypothetical protein D3Y55_23145 [Mesorhizobium sp. DCY119]|jgi:hypothetical protein|nr:hypothetical protein D3Y55_23145 [Mesorhizobium sp. DCY119]
MIVPFQTFACNQPRRKAKQLLLPTRLRSFANWFDQLGMKGLLDDFQKARKTAKKIKLDLN